MLKEIESPYEAVYCGCKSKREIWRVHKCACELALLAPTLNFWRPHSTPLISNATPHPLHLTLTGDANALHTLPQCQSCLSRWRVLGFVFMMFHGSLHSVNALLCWNGSRISNPPKRTIWSILSMWNMRVLYPRQNIQLSLLPSIGSSKMPICPNLFNVKYASPLPPPRKAISGPSLIAAGSLGKEGREKNVRQFRTGWDRAGIG